MYIILQSVVNTFKSTTVEIQKDCLVSSETTKLSSKVAVSFYISTSNECDFSVVSHPCQETHSVSFLDFSHSNRYTVVSLSAVLICHSQMTND